MVSVCHELRFVALRLGAQSTKPRNFRQVVTVRTPAPSRSPQRTNKSQAYGLNQNHPPANIKGTLLSTSYLFNLIRIQ